jgi:hypothetical protein
MKKLSSTLVIVLIIFSIMCFAPLVSGEGARIWTDKEDYAAGETVSIFGSGFNALAKVTVTIKRPNGVIDTVYAVTDNAGGFSCTYQLNGIAGTYTVTATDGTNTATTTFIDRTWSVSVSPTSATVSQGGSTTATVTVTASPTGGPEVDLWATGQPAGVTVSFSPTKGTPYFTSTMSINVGSTTTSGTYPINIIVFTGKPGEPSYSEKARTTFTLTVTVILPTTVSITVTSWPVTGLVFVKVDGANYTTPHNFTWTPSDTHTLEALSPVAGPTGIQYVWTSWSDGGAQTHDYVVPGSDATVTANYKTQYQITVTASPSGALGGTFKVTYTQCGTTYTNIQKTTTWTEWADADTTVTVSEPQDIINSKYKFDHYDPAQSVTMSAAKTITLFYIQISGLSVSINPTTGKIKVGESVAFTSTVSGGLSPYSYQWYLNGAAVPGATSPTWTFTPTTTGTCTVYLNITDSVHKTAKSNEASVTVAPPLTVLISPTSASILVGQSVTFTSTVSGGYTPYSYQWYLDGTSVSGTTSSSWTFTPTASGVYYVYLKVTDANNNVVQSETSRISVAAVPVGGYSISLAKQTSTSHIAAYTMLIALFAVAMSIAKRKRK